MIYQVTVKFALREALVFDRKEDASEIEPGKYHKMSMTLDRSKLTFIEEGRSICKVYTSPFAAEEKQGKVIVFQLSKDEEEKKEILIIEGSTVCLNDLQDTIGTSRKYKSCLSFIPSKVKHISILSGESPTQRFRGFMNLIGIMFVILNLRNIIDNFVKYGVRFQRSPSDFIALDTIVAIFGLLLFPIMIHLVEKIKFKKYASKGFCKFIEILIVLGILLYNIKYCSLYNPMPIQGLGFTMISLVMFVKMISFVQVNNQLFEILKKLKQIKGKSTKKTNISEQIFSTYEINPSNLELIIKNEASWERIISFEKLMYFILAPTLCYQLQYPRTSSIRYGWLAKRIAEFFIVTSLQAIIWFQYINLELESWHGIWESGNYTWVDVVHHLMRLSIPNTMMWIAGFYNMFHALLNILAQVLRFGDRKFYLDWWNCRNLEEYWKTWNLPVHFWFIRHVYNPLLQRGFSKVSANIIVFLISAVAHEYLVAVPLKLISYWAFLAMLTQAPVIIIQKKIDKMFKLSNSELGNVSFWLFFCFIGQPIIVFIYYQLYMNKIATEQLNI